MSSFAVGSTVETRRAFFAGGITVPVQSGRFGWTVVYDSEAAFKLESRAAAAAIAEGLTELCRVNGQPSTWYVVEIPEPPRASPPRAATAPHRANRDGAADRAGASPPSLSARPVPPSAGDRDA